MSDTTPHPFDEVLSHLSLPAQFDSSSSAVVQQQRWEHKVMSLVCSHFGLSDHASSMAKRCREMTGYRRLAFRYFLEGFPSFPTWLCCRKVPQLHKTSVGDLVNRWTTTPLFKAFVDAEAESEAASEAEWPHVALVFEWLHVWPVCVMHNNYRASELSETVVYRPLRHTSPPQILAVQSFQSFLSSISWSPR